jgi:GMP synthase (glutamine-hydrolysing)
MKKLLIIKTGSTLPSLLAKKGDFEDWVLSGMGVDKDQSVIADVCNEQSLPGYDEVSGAVITGSHAMVTEHLDWSERTADWLQKSIGKNIPILGICYGHQLLAYALGGEVGNNPKGRELGTVSVFLNQHVQNDRLLNGLNNPLEVHVSHEQTVLRLPSGAKRLAISNGDDCQAFVVGDCVWGLQFHPEFDREITVEYIADSRAELIAKGKNPDVLIKKCKDTPYGTEILKRFVKFCE